MKGFFLIFITGCMAIKGYANPPSGTTSLKTVADLGLGLGIGVEQYKDGTYIDSASTNGSNRIVSIDKEFQTVPSAWLTVNWNVDPFFFINRGKIIENQSIRSGLFVGAKLFDTDSSTSALSAFALGPQISFVSNNRQYSVGVGWVTHQTKKLAAGIREGQPLPSQYADIKYHTGSENSYMLMFTINLMNSDSLKSSQ